MKKLAVDTTANMILNEEETLEYMEQPRGLFQDWKFLRIQPSAWMRIRRGGYPA